MGTQLGDHPFESIEFLKYKNWIHAFKVLRSLQTDSTIFYGDFYNSFLLVLAKVKFHFTYHDNWPELGEISLSNRLKSLFYTNVYKLIFRRASATISVSNFKYDFIKQYSQYPFLICNGFNTGHLSITEKKARSVLMVGNIDARKYKQAIKLFKQLASIKNLVIDIYGHIIDKNLAKRLDSFSFVHLKGFKNTVPYGAYQLLLHTSFSESFGMVFCEAIYAGVPVLAFDTGGAREVVLGKKQGVLVKKNHIKTMKRELANMIEHPIEAPQLDIEKYSWDKAANEYEDLLITSE